MPRDEGPVGGPPPVLGDKGEHDEDPRSAGEIRAHAELAKDIVATGFSKPSAQTVKKIPSFASAVYGPLPDQDEYDRVLGKTPYAYGHNPKYSQLPLLLVDVAGQDTAAQTASLYYGQHLSTTATKSIKSKMEQFGTLLKKYEDLVGIGNTWKVPLCLPIIVFKIYGTSFANLASYGSPSWHRYDAPHSQYVDPCLFRTGF